LKLKKEDIDLGYNDAVKEHKSSQPHSGFFANVKHTFFKNPIIGLSILIFLLILWFLSGILESKTPAAQASLDNTQKIEKPLMRVSVVNSQSEIKETFYAVRGSTQADQKATLRAQVKGRVTFVAAKGSQLKAGQPVAQMATEDKLARLKAAQTLVSQTKLEYEAAKKLGRKAFKAKTVIAQRKAAYENALAALDTSQQDFNNLKVQAPFDGVLDDRAVEVGDYLAVGDAVASFVNLDPMLVIVHVAESFINNIKNNTKAQIILYDGSIHEGIVRFISQIAEPTTRSYRVEIEIPNTDRKIPDGVTAEARIKIAHKPVHRIRSSILALNDEGDAGIKAVGESGKVRFYPISIHNHDESGLWVEGLPDQAQIIVKGQDFVKIGQEVEAIPVDSITLSEIAQ